MVAPGQPGQPGHPGQPGQLGQPGQPGQLGHQASRSPPSNHVIHPWACNIVQTMMRVGVFVCCWASTTTPAKTKKKGRQEKRQNLVFPGFGAFWGTGLPEEQASKKQKQTRTKTTKEKHYKTTFSLIILVLICFSFSFCFFVVSSSSLFFYFFFFFFLPCFLLLLWLNWVKPKQLKKTRKKGKR